MHTTIMKDTSSRRTFLQRASLLPLAAAGVASLGSLTATAREPIKRGGQARIRIALNAYSFSKLLNDHVKGRGDGVSLLDLLDYCAKHEFEALDPTGYFFPGYPKVPADDYVNNLKRRAFESGVGISGTRVRNNFTTADKAVREAGVQHIKEWVEVAARLGAPVIRVFCDTQMRGQSWETVAPGRKREEVEDWITGHLKDCAEVGKKFGVIIGVQNHGDFLKTHVEHLNLCRHVDSEWCAAHRGHGLLQDRGPLRRHREGRAALRELAGEGKPLRLRPRSPHRPQAPLPEHPCVRLSRLRAAGNALRRRPGLRPVQPESRSSGATHGPERGLQAAEMFAHRQCSAHTFPSRPSAA